MSILVEREPLRFAAPLLKTRVYELLSEAGADDASAAAATRAMLHASQLGIDSHGVRLAAFYAEALRSGQVNGKPHITVSRTAAASAMVDADHGLGHAAAYKAMEVACDLARECGVGAVGIARSSHYGAAGAYALAGAEGGFVSIATTNADSLVALHDGAAPFHGTNPIAAAAPVPGGRPWLLDMATSSIPYNRVLLFRSLQRDLPFGVAADTQGQFTRDPNEAAMLIPLGAEDFGFKGAGLAGLVTILSAVLTGATPDHRVPPMNSKEENTPRPEIGHFCVAFDPDRFGGRATYDRLIADYLASLRGSSTRLSNPVMAPGDREWQVMAERASQGIPVDPETVEFLKLA